MKKKKLAKSLKLRIFLILVLIGMIPMLLLRAGLLRTYEDKAVSNRSISILGQAKVIGNQMVSHDYLKNRSSNVINTQLDILSSMYDGRILVITPDLKIVKDTYSLDNGKIIISEEVIKSFKGEEITKYDSENKYIEMSIPLLDNDTQEILGVMLISVSTDSIIANYEYLADSTNLIVIGATILILVVSIFLALNLMRPFSRITKSMNATQGGWENELTVYDYNETQAISEAYNALMKRIRIIDQSRQEFVSNVSHELKTPLTSMKVLADSLVGQENVPVELYREFMADIADEIDRENKIINDLLSLVKMDRSTAELNVSTVNINELMEQILKRLNPIAEKQEVDLVLESFRPITAEVDEVKLSLAITNLVENAIKYNKKGGWVHVSLNADHKYFYVKVQDTGLGIPKESLEHIYERFYRVDKSHSREIGGTGLGLAITRSAVLMHRGAIKVFSTEGEGTTFNVRIPLSYMS